jgi:hypothetical protein
MRKKATIAATDTKYVGAISPKIFGAASKPIQLARTTANG